MLQLESHGRHVFTKVAGTYGVTKCPQDLEQFRRDEMELAQVRQRRPAPSEKPVPDMLTRVRIALNAVTFNEVDALLTVLTEAVLRIRRHFEHFAFECTHRVVAAVQ